MILLPILLTVAGYQVVDGDILKTTPTISVMGHQADVTRTWPNGVVPYAFSPEVDAAERHKFLRAVESIHAQTLVRVIPRTTQADFVLLQRAPLTYDYCASALGRVGGAQVLYIRQAGCPVSTYVHELGHTLGLGHEHQRPDRDTYLNVNLSKLACPYWQFSADQKSPNNRDLSGYDHDSIMTYGGGGCTTDGTPLMTRKDNGQPTGPQSANLTPLDVRAFNILATNSPAVADTQRERQRWRRSNIVDTNGDGRSDLLQAVSAYASKAIEARPIVSNGSVLYQGGSTFALGYLGTSKVLYGDADNDSTTDMIVVRNCDGYACIDAVSTNPDWPRTLNLADHQGGYWDAQEWFTGDFNGDGRMDLGKCWSDLYSTSCDVHLVEYSWQTYSYVSRMYRWVTNAPKHAKILPGDFNGDGKTDLAMLRNDGNAATVSVLVSSGASSALQTWAYQQGGYWDAQSWHAADFNGDGKTDLAKYWKDEYWNYPAAFTADVHISTGSSFIIQRWATRNLYFTMNETWLVGDFTGDAKADFVKVFPCGTGPQACMYVYVSTGYSFYPSLFGLSQGGHWLGQAWHVGDYNGDGRDDLAKYWPEGAGFSLDAHVSTGASFVGARMGTGVSSYSGDRNVMRVMP